MKDRMKGVVCKEADERIKGKIVKGTLMASSSWIVLFLIIGTLATAFYTWAAFKYLKLNRTDLAGMIIVAELSFDASMLVGIIESAVLLINIKRGKVYTAKCTFILDTIRDFNKHYKLICCYYDGKSDINDLKLSNVDCSYVQLNSDLQYYVGWIKGVKPVFIRDEQAQLE